MDRPVDIFFARHSKRPRPELGDRFVPQRRDLISGEVDSQAVWVPRDPSPECPNKKQFQRLLKKNLVGDRSRQLNFFAPRQRANKVDERNDVSIQPATPVPCWQTLDAGIAKAAPGVKTSYMLSLVDWSRSGLVAVALTGIVYIMRHPGTEDSVVHRLVDIHEDFCMNAEEFVTCLRFACDGKHLAVGLSNGWMMLFDAEKLAKLRCIKDTHDARLGALSWNFANITTGYGDGTILHSDGRVLNHKVSKFKGHGGRICGLSWSEDLSHLASGGKDKVVRIWELKKTTPVQELRGHQGTVKGMSWSKFNPHHLVTGGLLNDGHINVWNTATGKHLHSFNTGRPVSSVHWNPFKKEILTSHSEVSNKLYCWSYPAMEKSKELSGHRNPVIDTAVSPDGKKVISISGDDSIRFWDVFEEETEKPQQLECSLRHHSILR